MAMSTSFLDEDNFPHHVAGRRISSPRAISTKSSTIAWSRDYSSSAPNGSQTPTIQPSSYRTGATLLFSPVTYFMARSYDLSEGGGLTPSAPNSPGKSPLRVVDPVIPETGYDVVDDGSTTTVDDNDVAVEEFQVCQFVGNTHAYAL